MAFETINIEQAKALISSENAIVIDIRDQASFESGHIESAIHVDNSNAQGFIDESDQQRPLIVCCYHGNMSKGAADYFNTQGFENAYSLDGGYADWATQQD